MIKLFRRSRIDYPKGVLAIYDNGGRTADRYTVVYKPERSGADYVFPVTDMSAYPFWPQGVCQHSELHFRPTSDSGTGQKLIAFEALPPNCQRAVMLDLESSEGQA